MRVLFLFWRGEREEDPADPAVLFLLHLTGTGVRATLAQQNERSRSSHADRTHLSTQGSRPANASAPESRAAGSGTGLEVLPRAPPGRESRAQPLARSRRLAAGNQGWAVCAAQPIYPVGLSAIPRQRRDHQAAAPRQPAPSLPLPPQEVPHGAVARPGGFAPGQAPDPAHGPGAQVLLLPSARSA